jgi:hypothetical protein
MLQEEVILQKLISIEESSGKLISEMEKLVIGINKFIETNTKKTDEALKWAQEFHRMLIDEYAAGAQGKVYAFLFVDAKTTTRKLIQVIASDMEKAYQIAKEKLVSVESVPADWSMEFVSKQPVPLDKDNKILDKVEDEMKFDRPLDVYINGLNLARDRFASTPLQKKSINAVIEIIKKTNAR